MPVAGDERLLLATLMALTLVSGTAVVAMLVGAIIGRPCSCTRAPTRRC